MAFTNNTVIIIAGATAVGKTAVAIDVAKHFGTEIISADSRQCYQELSIGVARPSIEELSQVPHHFIASHSIHQKITAKTFEEYALEKLAVIFKTKTVAVMVGGTGLYLKAFCEGLDEIPEVPAAIHVEVMNGYQQNGLAWLQGQVQQYDPLFYATGENQNPQRLMRALEVVKATHQSIVSLRKKTKVERPFTTIKTVLSLPKEALHQRIHARVDKMMEEGLKEEVKSLLPYKHLTALQTVGYKELFRFFDGTNTLAEAIEKIKISTRQYAKRQVTWFNADDSYKKLEPDAQKIIGYSKLV